MISTRELVGLAISRLIESAEKKQQTPRQIILRPFVIERGSVAEKE